VGRVDEDVARRQLLEQSLPRRESAPGISIGRHQLRALDQEDCVQHVGDEDEARVAVDLDRRVAGLRR
jgi:hypothetical protein